MNEIRNFGRLPLWLAGAALALLATPAAAETPDVTAFAQYLIDLWPQASVKGVSRKTFDSVIHDLHFDPKIAAHTETQAEFSVSIPTYLAGAVIPSRVEAGRKQYEDARAILKQARETYGVDAGAIMGAWGIETEFGAFFGGENVVSALATLGYMRYQGDLGRDELIAALQMLEAGEATVAAMRGSWAGAMGQPQFMPSSFLEFAVDFDGDGKRDIWKDKADSLGSIANYLAKHGWTPDLPWMVEAKLPADYKYEPVDFKGEAKFSDFAAKGVRRANGEALPGEGKARIYMPAGVRGPTLLATHNFDVIKTYNNSNAYVLAVGLLGDAIVGRGGLKTPWPKGERALSRAEVKQVQSQLKTQGFEIGEIDGRAGPKLEQAVRAYQFKQGLTPDGFAGPALLSRLKTSS
jgi:lytic murein transglycosylase